MVVTTVEAYQNARVHTITVKNKKFFQIKIVDVQNGLRLNCVCDLIRREICGIYETDNLTKEQRRKYMRSEFEIIKDFANKKSKYARNDIMEKVIKNFRGVKKSNNSLNILDKEKKQKIFDYFWGLKKMKYMTAKNTQC